MLWATISLPPCSSPVLLLPRGVGLSFFFAAPLILLVLITFLVGGNVQTLLCRSWESGELYEVSPHTLLSGAGSKEGEGSGHWVGKRAKAKQRNEQA